MRFSFNNKVLITTILLISFVSCRKKGCTDPLASNYDSKANYDNGLCEYDTSNIYNFDLKIYHLFNSIPFHLDSVYNDDYGNKIKFSRAVFYAGNPSFMDINGVINQSTNDYLLINPTDTIYQFVSLTNPDINSMNIRIGVDSITNHTDPGEKEINDPLSYQSPSMHWQMGLNPTNWSYLFIVIEGQVDVNGNNNFDPGENFIFHIGGDDFSRLTNNLSVSIADNSTFFNFDINWDTIIDDIDLSVDNFTHTMDNIPLATKIANNSINLISEHL